MKNHTPPNLFQLRVGMSVVVNRNSAAATRPSALGFPSFPGSCWLSSVGGWNGDGRVPVHDGLLSTIAAQTAAHLSLLFQGEEKSCSIGGIFF